MEWTGDHSALASRTEGMRSESAGSGERKQASPDAVHVANGNRIDVSVQAVYERLSPSGCPLLVVTFSQDLAGRDLRTWRASLHAEVGIDANAEWTTARRKAARGLIAFGLQTADAVARGDLRPSITPSPAPFTGNEMEYLNRVVTAGLSRGASMECHVEEGGRYSPRLDPHLPVEAGDALRRLARELHGSIGLRENRSLFGLA